MTIDKQDSPWSSFNQEFLIDHLHRSLIYVNGNITSRAQQALFGVFMEVYDATKKKQKTKKREGYPWGN